MASTSPLLPVVEVRFAFSGQGGGVDDEAVTDIGGEDADHRAGEGPACTDEGEDVDAERFGRRSDVDEDAVDGEQAEVGVEIDAGADRVDDEVEPAGELLERAGVGGRVVMVSAESQAVFLLLVRLGERTRLTC